MDPGWKSVHRENHVVLEGDEMPLNPFVSLGRNMELRLSTRDLLCVSTNIVFAEEYQIPTVFFSHGRRVCRLGHPIERVKRTAFSPPKSHSVLLPCSQTFQFSQYTASKSFSSVSNTMNTDIAYDIKLIKQEAEELCDDQSSSYITPMEVVVIRDFHNGSTEQYRSQLLFVPMRPGAKAYWYPIYEVLAEGSGKSTVAGAIADLRGRVLAMQSGCGSGADREDRKVEVTRR